jgi:antitoxin HigA-1
MSKLKHQPIEETTMDWQPPIHPGEIIRRRFFAPLSMSQADFCKKWDISTTIFSRLLNGKQRITTETATTLSAAFGMSAMFFMNLQSRYDLETADRKKD